jgi:hypothetical protein
MSGIIIATNVKNMLYEWLANRFHMQLRVLKSYACPPQPQIKPQLLVINKIFQF